MIFLILYMFLFYTATAERNLKVVKYENSVDTIVRDLIDNWQSPLVYLKSRGYLPKDAPEMDFQQLQGNSVPELPLKDLIELNKDSKREAETKSQGNPVEQMDPRAVRSLQDPKDLELKRMFQTLFSSSDKTASEEIQSKLGVSWDMNALKSSARLGAKKYLEKYNNKRNQGLTESQDGSLTNVASLNFSSLIPHILEKKSNDSMAKSSVNKPTFLKGVARILSNPEIRYRDWDSKPAQEILPKAAGT
ncbi:uncharacterized protein LOC6532096 [Drosophila yakuba]|uniref:Seminal fluid protein n=1 Tax=Drosophila yakuba TaxID=7245 RepID=B4PBF2_DROYA|nr:uncharacterized protein LOC6532096 [Drosophila yakuba]EDW92584.1 uncharacterized protein Dyak_GE11429 [Drosophila yakuba]